jgi:hypothetical protein
MNPNKNAYMAAQKRVVGVSNLLQFRDIDNAKKLVVASINMNPSLSSKKK